MQFNAGSSLGASAMASHVWMTTNAAAGTAMLGWLLMDHLRGHKIRATGACVGAVIGLVAITPAAGALWIRGSIAQCSLNLGNRAAT
jgi:Amt family ammonium transporter